MGSVSGSRSATLSEDSILTPPVLGHRLIWADQERISLNSILWEEAGRPAVTKQFRNSASLFRKMRPIMDRRKKSKEATIAEVPIMIQSPASLGSLMVQNLKRKMKMNYKTKNASSDNIPYGRLHFQPGLSHTVSNFPLWRWLTLFSLK